MRHHTPEDREFFVERYGRPISDAARKFERAVFGHEIGLNGFTTVAQAHRLSDLLELGSQSTLLDVGAGRGWPGLYIARSSQCRVVLSDIPIEALRQAPYYAEQQGVAGLVSAVCADGVALPFVPASFDALAHTDLLC